MDNVRKLREDLGLSVRALADLAKCGKSTISDIENGREPDVYLAIRLARALGVTVEQLFWEE